MKYNLFAAPTGPFTVHLGANWRPYADEIPEECRCLGTITMGDGITAALVRLIGGRYAVISGRILRLLDGRKIARQINNKSTKPKTLVGLRKSSIVLDEETDAIARRILPGNFAGAIRLALRFWAVNHPLEEHVHG